MVRAAVRSGLWLGAVVLVTAVLPLGSACASGPTQAEPAPLVLGVDDDHSKWLARPDGLIAKYRDLGLGAVRITIPWRQGESRPTHVRIYLHRAAMMIERGQRVVIGVFGRPSDAPLDGEGRRQYCNFLSYIVRRIPFHDVAIWNEANSPQFWPQGAAGGAPAYEALLSTCWRRLHALRPDINVISTTSAHHDPAGFMRELGAVYRERGRHHPIVDTFGHNPYPDYASEPPWVQHDDPGTVGEADLDRLLQAIHDGFAGTAQPLPLEGSTSVWYLETGFQTTVPRAKQRYYRGNETDPYVVPPVAPDGSPPWVRDQASQLRDALLLARCQPAVGAFFNFELLDEDRMSGWQSGVLWRDGTEKPSYAAFRAAVDVVMANRVDCATVPGAGGPLPPAPPEPTGPGPCAGSPGDSAVWLRCSPT
jgi:hypothetical protein